MTLEEASIKRIGHTGWAALLLACHVLGNNAVAAPGAIAVTPVWQSLGRSDDVLVTVTFTNTTAATAWLLKWQTPFAGVEAPLFDVTRDGLPVRYLGIQAKRPPPGAADYIALKPGESRSRQVALSVLYRMDVMGAYWAYGQAAAGALAASDPARALDNADSHEYFGENNPYQALRRK
jgi:peptidyl-Lys metalloendopeptidase